MSEEIKEEQPVEEQEEQPVEHNIFENVPKGMEALLKIMY